MMSTSKSTAAPVGSLSAGIQRSLSNRFKIANTIPSKNRSISRRKSSGRTTNISRQYPGRQEMSDLCQETSGGEDDIIARTLRLRQESIEWKERETTALARNLSQSCAVCCEFYGRGDEHQIILSCCHVYHPHCLNSFEKFVGFDKRFCPLCRVGNYSKSVTKIGSLTREKNAIVIIQKFIRGHLARQEFRPRLRSYYDSLSSATDDKVLIRIRQRFYAKELENLGRNLSTVIDFNDDSVGNLKNKIDESLRMSRASSRMLNERHRSASNAINWDVVMKVAFERREGDAQFCPICMSNMKEKGGRATTLLSCSHMFCSHCIQSFESFNAHRSEQNSCPVCRSTYDKLQIQL